MTSSRRRSQFYLLSLILVAVGFFLFGPLFRLRQVFCQIATNPCSPEILSYLHSLRGENLLLLKNRSIQAQISQINSQFKQINVSLGLPQSLRVIITPRIPFALVAVATDSSQLIVDDTGTIISQTATPSNLPVINLATPSSQILTSSIKLLHALDENFISYQSVTVSQPNILSVKLTNGLEVIFSSLRDFSLQVNSLQLILEKATIVTSPARIIDVRFNKPVIK